MMWFWGVEHGEGLRGVLRVVVRLKGLLERGR
jgi:hypothetical protein